MAILDFLVSGWHGFGSITQVCFGISVSNFMCMSFVAVGRSLTIVSYVAFKMAALWFWTMPPSPMERGILVDHWSTISSFNCISFKHISVVDIFPSKLSLAKCHKTLGMMCSHLFGLWLVAPLEKWKDFVPKLAWIYWIVSAQYVLLWFHRNFQENKMLYPGNRC